MRYSLRTLLILTILGPPLLATGWWAYGCQPPDLTFYYEQEKARLGKAYELWEILGKDRGSPFGD